MPSSLWGEFFFLSLPSLGSWRLILAKTRSSLIIFQNIVPNSLVITVELVKTLQALFIFNVCSSRAGSSYPQVLTVVS